MIGLCDIVLERELVRKLYEDLIDVQARIMMVGDMNGDVMLCWWLSILQKFLPEKHVCPDCGKIFEDE